MKTQTRQTLFLLGFCLASVLALPLTVGIAIFAACGGDKTLLHVLRGKIQKEDGLDITSAV